MRTKIVGWIAAKRSEEKELRKIGVEGKMIYNDKEQVFEYCEVTNQVMRRLMNRIDFFPAAFTILETPLLSLDGWVQKPHSEQIYWKMAPGVSWRSKVANTFVRHAFVGMF